MHGRCGGGPGGAAGIGSPLPRKWPVDCPDGRLDVAAARSMRHRATLPPSGLLRLPGSRAH
eukprot:11212444-Lingulodinium_polyedra.AAC.1